MLRRPPGITSDGINNDHFVRKEFDLSQQTINESPSLTGKKLRIRIVDESTEGYIYIDDFKISNLPGNPAVVYPQQKPLWGFVDMHTHPMSHLGFGRKIMHGTPDNPVNQTDIHSSIGNCNENHGEWGLDNTKGNYIRMVILKMMDKKNPYNNGELDPLRTFQSEQFSKSLQPLIC